MARGDPAVGECGVRLGEDVDEGGGEDDPRGEALDDGDGAVVEGFSLEEAGEEDGGGHAEHGGDEDDEDGEELEVRRRGSVAARGRAGGEVRRARWCRHGGAVWNWGKRGKGRGVWEIGRVF